MTSLDRFSLPRGCAEFIPKTSDGKALIPSAAVPRVNSQETSRKEIAALIGVRRGGVAVFVDDYKTLEHELIEPRSWARS